MSKKNKYGEKSVDSIVERFVRMFSRGSASLQRGQYSTEKDIARRREKISRHKFVSAS